MVDSESERDRSSFEKETIEELPLATQHATLSLYRGKCIFEPPKKTCYGTISCHDGDNSYSTMVRPFFGPSESFKFRPAN
jgi:hypothetical protein